MTNTTTSTALQMAAAAGAALASTDPRIALAEQLLTQGLQFWADFQAKKAAGALTIEDLDAAAAKTGADLAQLKAHIAAQTAPT